MGQDILSMISQSIPVDQSYRCEKVAMYTNFESKKYASIGSEMSENIVKVNED